MINSHFLCYGHSNSCVITGDEPWVDAMSLEISHSLFSICLNLITNGKDCECHSFPR